jgi:hypothetical protein
MDARRKLSLIGHRSDAVWTRRSDAVGAAIDYRLTRASPAQGAIAIASLLTAPIRPPAASVAATRQV